MNTAKNKAILPIIAFILAICTLFFVCAELFSRAAFSAEAEDEELSVPAVSFSDAVSPADVSATDAVSPSDVSGSDAAATTESPASSQTSETSASTTQTTQTTTTAKPTTTTTTAPDTRKNAQYVVNPNYESKYYIVVFAGDSQSVAIYSKDDTGAYTVLSKCFTCSTGAKSSPTRTGQYKIRAKYRWRLLVGNVYGQYSSSISSSYLFHSVPYLKQNNSALDMAEYDKLGSPASHGCIRLCTRDSKWIYDNCPIGTQVNIVNASGPAGQGYPARNPDPLYSGWDPSDPDPVNPYLTIPTTTTEESTTTTTETTTETTSTTAATTTETTSPGTTQSAETTAATAATEPSSTETTSATAEAG